MGKGKMRRCLPILSGTMPPRPAEVNRHMARVCRILTQREALLDKATGALALPAAWLTGHEGEAYPLPPVSRHRLERIGTPMPRLQEASHRLQMAIDRLEQVVAARAQAGKAGGDDGALREALEAARRENARLQQLAGTVSTRLDATIGRLRKLVG